MKINNKNCRVDKRSLVLDCEIDVYNTEKQREETLNIVFRYNGWAEGGDGITLEINGKISGNFNVIKAYKHRVFAYINDGDEGSIIIDRRYCHDNEYDIYYLGEHYLVDCK